MVTYATGTTTDEMLAWVAAHLHILSNAAMMLVAKWHGARHTHHIAQIIRSTLVPITSEPTTDASHGPPGSWQHPVLRPIPSEALLQDVHKLRHAMT